MKTLTWPQVIGRRLVRNHLVEPAPPERLVDVVRDACGIQAQVPAAAELGISARVTGITRQDVRDALWETHTLIRTNGPRETKHILPADEFPLWMAAMQAAASLRPKEPLPASVAFLQSTGFLDLVREILDGVTLTRDDLADKVARRAGPELAEPLRSPWGEYLEEAFKKGVLVHGPDEGGNATFARADQWIDNWEELDPTESLAEICRRYISSYGPVTHQDFARWFRIENEAARKVFDSIKWELVEAKIERRRAWILAADAESPWEPVEGSLRLIPQYDCYLLGFYPRPPVVPQAMKTFISTLDRASYEGAVGFSLLLIDGVVSGIWQRRPRGKRVEVTVTPIVTLTEDQRKQLDAEIERITAFLGTEVIPVINSA
jgi:hypothetical protein